MKNLVPEVIETLVTTTIQKREVIYYLINEDDLNSVKSKSWLTDAFMLLASLALGAFLSVIITLSTGVQLQEQVTAILKKFLLVFGFFGLLFLVLAAMFIISAKSAIDRIKGSGKVKTIGGLEPDQEPSLSVVAPSNPILEVIEAVYGTTKKSVDITTKLNQLIQDGTLTTIASNDLGGDPDLGTPKVLRIKYKHNGVIITKEYKEKDHIKLP